MIAQRLNPELVSPQYEDAGLFKAEICSLNLSLRPGVMRNARDDVIFDGVIDGRYQAPVFFAGRRAGQAALVVEAMARLVRHMGQTGASAAQIDAGVLPLQVDGAWRRVVQEDETGFARATHQFIAAAWTIGRGGDGAWRFGALPVR